MNRRGFLTGILAACAAPAIVRADSLMRIVPREVDVLTTYSATFEIRGTPQMPYMLVQWVEDVSEPGRVMSGGFLRGQELSRDQVFVPPPGVHSVWVSDINPDYAFQPGGRVLQPVRVVPGQRIEWVQQ